MRGARIGLGVVAVLLGLALLPASAAAVTFTRTARFPEPLWDVSAPMDIAAGPNGTLWVADNGHGRAVQLTTDGRELVSIGWRGVSTGLAGQALGIALAPDGTVWVTTGGSAVRHFSNTGTLLNTISLPPASTGYNPESVGISVDATGDVYVADRTVAAVYHYEPDGTLVRRFGRADGITRYSPGDFGFVDDVSVDASGNVWTAEGYNQRIQEFAPDGTVLAVFQPHDASGAVVSPRGVAPLPAGDVVVSAGGILLRCDSTGAYKQTYFEDADRFPYSYPSPGDVSVDSSGTLYWADIGTATVKVIASDGALLATYDRAHYYRELFGNPSSLAISRDGRVAVGQQDRLVRVFSPDMSSVLTTLTLPSEVEWASGRGMTFDGSGKLWVTDEGSGGLYAYRRDGSVALSLGGFWHPTGVGVDSGGDVYVADAYNWLLKHLDPGGNLISSWRSVSPGVVNYVFRQTLTVNRRDELYLSQQHSFQSSDSIFHFDRTGSQLQLFGSSGTGAGQFAGIGQMTTDRYGRLWVCDTRNARIQWFDRDGSFLGSWGGWDADAFSRPDGIAFDPAGNLWVVDSGKNTLERYAVADLPSPPQARVDRLQGSTRYLTAVAASQARFTRASGVVLATGEAFPDALSGSALAGAVHGPLLLATRTAVPSEVQKEVARLGATTVYVVGGQAAIADSALVPFSKLHVVRVKGDDRYGTAAAVAAKVAVLTGSDFGHRAFLARGDQFADAAAAAALAYSQRMPILLTRPAALPSATWDALRSLNVTGVVIAGSGAAVNPDVESLVRSGGVSVDRCQGGDRYATAKALAEYGVAQRWGDLGFVGVAVGTAFPDALTGGALTGAHGGVLLLTPTASLAPASSDTLRDRRLELDTVTVFGSTTAVSSGVESTIRSVAAR